MSDFNDTTTLEKTSLEAHVDLCAMRYGQLDNRLISLEDKMNQIQLQILAAEKSMKITLITSAATVMASAIGVVITIMLK